MDARGRRGFVLAMALALIAVAGIALAGLARHSLELAREAAAEQESLQRRWGIVSCRQMLLEQAEALLEAEAAKSEMEELPWPLPANRRFEFRLGGLQFVAHLADEDAKVNLNEVYFRRPDALWHVIASAQGASASQGLTTRLHVLPEAENSGPAPPLQSWGQVFAPLGGDGSREAGQMVFDSTRDITCWGNGRLNLRRASDDAVRVLCEMDLPGDVVRKVLAARREPQTQELDDVLRRLTLKSEQRTALRRLLTDRSECHSLWIFVQGERRVWSSLAIDQVGPLGGERLTFRW